MNLRLQRWNRLNIGTKLTGGLLLLTTICLVLMMVGINQIVTRQFETRATQQVVEQTQVMVRLLETTDQDLQQRRDFLAQAFGHLLDGKGLNLDPAQVDAFTQSTDAVATLFARTGDDFVRITTSLKDEKGERAVGTLLDRQHPGYERLLRGENYVGLATLFGHQYMTRYDPLRDADGKLVGARFIGVDFTSYMEGVKQAIRKIKIGETGYFYVLNAAPGPQFGRLEVHPFREGTTLLDQKDANGRPFVRDILEQKNGQIRYPWINSEAKESAARDKVVAFSHFKNWNWVLAGGAYIDEYTSEMNELRNVLLGLFVVFLGLFALASHLLVRRLITRPLAEVQGAATAVAQGNLTVELTSDREDEIGVLMTSMNSIGSSLSQVVQIVRENSGSVATSCQEMAQGNQDLSNRTENQAAALEQTVSSMTELGSTVRQNAENARLASQLAQQASEVASDGGKVVSEVVQTMKGINDSAKRIADIISVMDGISFQTNILALNAAVEAARAGESGRGFAVVASEVRNLASRSTEAAREIRTLIHDSVERTEQGSAQVHQAGQTMTQIVHSIQRVTDLMGEISEASREQNDGVAQISQAVAQIDQVTQQNAALVEEMAAAASSLKAQADDLVMSVEVFQL